MKKIIVAPSLLAAKKIVEEAKAIENIENVWLHFDVMDGKFVPNTSFSLEDLALMRKETNLFLDVHLMIENPEVHFMDYVNNGADLVTIHYEATSDLSSLIRNIKNSGVKVGVSIKPKTEVEVLFPYLKELDLVLVMSVEPGFGGQSFIPGALEKIEKLRDKQEAIEEKAWEHDRDMTEKEAERYDEIEEEIEELEEEMDNVQNAIDYLTDYTDY